MLINSTAKVWRKWHVKLSLGQKRFATASAIAASASAPLLLARGHRISSVPEVPFVVSSSAFTVAKTSAAVKLLKEIGAGPDVDKVKKSRKLRAGKGKLRGRRYRQRRGPLIVYNPETDGKEIGRAFRNISGVEASSVFSLNLLQLAPGGHLGRFIIWTSSAFEALDKVYGSTTEASALKKDFLLPAATVSQPDISKLINSSEIQAVLRPVKGSGISKRPFTQKKNPLVNKQVMLRLNPYAAQYSKDKLGQKKLEGDKPEARSEEFDKLINEN
jgi:large subunit ribosomal protein L4e